MKGIDHYSGKYIILLKRNQLFAIVQMNGRESFNKAFSDD